MENISLVFGKRIKSLRTSRKLSQEKLAELSGLHPTYIGQIERGEKSPTIDTVQKLSVGLGVSVAEFFGRADESESSIYAVEIYDEVLALPREKQEKIYRILKEISDF